MIRQSAALGKRAPGSVPDRFAPPAEPAIEIRYDWCVSGLPPTQSDQLLPRDIAPARCLDCYYVLEGLEELRCPECGRSFDLYDAGTFTRKPPYVWWKLWLPGLVQAMIFGVVSMAIMALLGQWGWALWVGVPLAAGCLLGYRFRAAWILFPALVMTVLTGLILSAIVLHLAGLYCGLILGGIFLSPIVAGAIAGVILRLILKARGYEQSAYLPSLILFALLLVGAVIEDRFGATPPRESVSTTRIIHAPIETAWESIMFYEELTHDPPWILRIGLAHPLRTYGSSASVGDEKVCIYNKGRLTKRIAEVEAPHLLAFTITEQSIGYERDVHLTGGSFRFEAVDEKTTRVTLMTEYEPLLGPRFAWRWGEHYAVRTLHEHVLEGMAREAEPGRADSAAVHPARWEGR